MIRTLTFSTLFPNKAQPIHGIFVENRLRHLIASGEVSTTVIAPVPWFPVDHAAFGSYATYAKVPLREQRHGLDIVHPRFLRIPKMGMTVAPALLCAAALPAIRRLRAEGQDFDLIDAHYFYPDGVAAALIGRLYKKPVVITGRGTDLSLIPDYSLPRRQIQWAAGSAAGLVTVCQALKDSLVGLGVAADKVTVLRNGIDLNVFHPHDRLAARKELGVDGGVIASVGGLVERKGHHLVVEALSQLPGFTLLIAGDGPERKSLENLASARGVSDRVRLLGAVSHDRLRKIYEAADVTVLASSREGWANVLLESMACGTPVVATRIWGTPEVVSAPEAGCLIDQRSANGVAGGIRALLANPPDRAATAQFAAQFTWDYTTAGQLNLFRRILGK